MITGWSGSIALICSCISATETDPVIEITSPLVSSSPGSSGDGGTKNLIDWRYSYVYQERPHLGKDPYNNRQGHLHVQRDQ